MQSLPVALCLTRSNYHYFWWIVYRECDNLYYINNLALKAFFPFGWLLSKFGISVRVSELWINTFGGLSITTHRFFYLRWALRLNVGFISSTRAVLSSQPFLTSKTRQYNGFPLVIMIMWHYTIGPLFARFDVIPSQQPVFKLRFLRLHLLPACFHRPITRAACDLNRLYSNWGLITSLLFTLVCISRYCSYALYIIDTCYARVWCGLLA